MKEFLIQFIIAEIGVAIIILTPYAIKALKAAEAYFITLMGAKNYAYVKQIIYDIVIANQGIFSEDNIVNLIDTIDNKFGDKLNRDEIKQIIDAVIADLHNDKSLNKLN